MLDTTLVAGAISAFPVPQRERDQFITITFGQLQEIIAEAVKAALERVSGPEADITTLKAEIASLNASQGTLEFHLSKQIAEDRRRIAAIENQPPSRTIAAPAAGTKTAARLSQIKTILKDRGATTFKEIERILEITPREMVRLTKKLDMRFFEITRRPGDARQKVIRLRSQIG